jgi:hypothetical protein
LGEGGAEHRMRVGIILLHLISLLYRQLPLSYVRRVQGEALMVFDMNRIIYFASIIENQS